MSIYIYAETAFHHEGSKEHLIKLIDEAKKAEVNGVKFQVLINIDEFMSPLHSAYQEAINWVLTLDEWKEVFQYTEKLNLDIVLMPLDSGAFELIKDFKIKFIEIHSVSFKDEVLLSKLSEYNIPLIFGIGGRTVEEIDSIVKKYKDVDITLMVGFQSFPSQLEDIKLGRIKELSRAYPKCTIGYADHSSYEDDLAIVSNEYAYVLGARFFEKHITLNEGQERIDYQSAINADKIKAIKTRLDFLDKILNIDEKELFDMNEKEIKYRNRQKVPVAKSDMSLGKVVLKDMLTLKMIDTPSCIETIDDIIGKKLNKNIPKNQVFFADDLI